MGHIIHDGKLLAQIVHKRDFPSGMQFWGKDESPLQFGSCVYNKGTELQPHIHKERKRIKRHRTIEFLYIVKGKIEANFYSPDKELVATRVLREGDCVMLYNGGHGFKVLADNTIFIEVKNGPYISVEADKEKF